VCDIRHTGGLAPAYLRYYDNVLFGIFQTDNREGTCRLTKNERVQERINHLLPFDTTRAAQKMARPTILLLRTYFLQQ
jgi:hypothetical protein